MTPHGGPEWVRLEAASRLSVNEPISTTDCSKKLIPFLNTSYLVWIVKRTSFLDVGESLNSDLSDSADWMFSYDPWRQVWRWRRWRRWRLQNFSAAWVLVVFWHFTALWRHTSNLDLQYKDFLLKNIFYYLYECWRNFDNRTWNLKFWNFNILIFEMHRHVWVE